MRNDQPLAVIRQTLPQWGRITAANVVVVLAALLALEWLWTDGPTAGFLAAVGLVLVLESVLLLGLLATVASGQRPVDRPVTLATWVTLARGAAVAVLAGFVATAPTGVAVWAPGALFATAAALDAVDGALARATDSVTDLGARLDVEMDGLVVLVGTLVAIVDGALPTVFLAVAGARYLFVVGRWWRKQRSRSVYELPRNPLRRPLGALAMLVVWLALLPAPGVTLSHALALIVLVPFLANFCWDWLAVTGRVRSTAEA